MKSRIGALERDVKALEATEQALLREVDQREERIHRLETEGMAREDKLRRTNEEIRAILDERLRRMGRALFTAVEVLGKTRPPEEEAEIAREIRAYLGETGDLDHQTDLALSEIEEAAAIMKLGPAPSSPPLAMQTTGGPPPLPQAKSVRRPPFLASKTSAKPAPPPPPQA